MMTDKEIITKALEKVCKKGYKMKRYHSGTYDCDYYKFGYYIDICSHEFAKAFWGTQKICLSCGATNEDYPCRLCEIADYPEGEMWQYHLQQMILESNPLKYLEKFL